MATITLENVPVSLEKKLGHKVDFSKIVGIYFDGMDWCQYDEVIPSQDDLKALKNISEGGKEAFSFLKSLK